VIDYFKELYILSTFGLTNLEDLLRGSATNELRVSPSAKITRFLRRDVIEGIDGHGWSIQIHPADGFLQIITPEPSNTPYLQYVQNLTTKAWGLWEDVPMLSGEEWNGSYYMGGKDGKVWIYDGTLDGALLDATPGEPIEFNILTSFQVHDMPHAIFKRVGFVRPIGLTTQGALSVNVKAVYDYDIEPIINLPPGGLPIADGGIWNSSVWNNALWSGPPTGASIPIGALGMGRAVAIGMRGTANDRVSLVGWDITLTAGGVL